MKKEKKVKIGKSVLQKIGNSANLKLGDPPKNDPKSEKIIPNSDLCIVGGGEVLTTLKVKGGDELA